MKYSIAPPTASTMPTMLAQLRLALTTIRTSKSVHRILRNRELLIQVYEARQSLQSFRSTWSVWLKRNSAMEAGTTTITAPATRLRRKLVREGVIAIGPEPNPGFKARAILGIVGDFLRC